MNRTRSVAKFQAVQDHRPRDVVARSRPVGLLLHSDGTLRLFQDSQSGHLFIEVNGMQTDAARHFLALLDGLPDVTSEILVSDRPDEYPLDAAPVRERHVRRHA